LSVWEKPVFESADNIQTDCGKPVDFFAKQTNRFSGLFVLGELEIVFVRNPQIVSYDMALLYIDSQECEVPAGEPRKRVDGEDLEILADAVNVLKDGYL
jgi:hypothetical protein